MQGMRHALPFLMQPAGPGSRPAWLTPVLIVATFVVVAALARFRNARQKRRLPALMAAEGAEWASLCRVLADGRFLDRGRARRGGGPSGTLHNAGETLHWRPDAWATRHGSQPLSWPVHQVRCVGRKRTRDIIGFGYDRVELLLPEGSVVFAVFSEKGQRPASLDC
jgi:hypothetical protein